MYSFDGRVRYSECNEDGRLSLVSMMNYLQDCSTFHSEATEVGLDWLKEQGLGWILGSWLIEIDELPRFAEKIRTNTWCYSLKGLHAQRCFSIEDSTGRPVVRADSQWFLFDRNAGKVCRIPDSQRVYLSDEPRQDLPAMERKIKVDGEGRQASPIQVSEQHLDTNRHVNNAQYVMFALDAIAELGHPLDVHRIAVQYRTMAWLGNKIVPLVHVCEAGYTVELTNGEGATYAVVKLQEA